MEAESSPKPLEPSPPRVSKAAQQRRPSQSAPKRESDAGEVTPLAVDLVAVSGGATVVNSNDEIKNDIEADGGQRGSILVEKKRYECGDVVVFEALDAHSVWQWAVGKINVRLSPRVIEVSVWEPREKSLTEEQRVAAEAALNDIRAQTDDAEEAIKKADAIAAELQEEALAIARTFDETQARLAQAQPLIDEARSAVSAISMEALRELRSYPQPPMTVALVLECVMLLIGGAAKENKSAMAKDKDARRSGGSNKAATHEPTWAAIKRFVMKETFIATVKAYDPSATSDAARIKIGEYASKPEFTFEKADRASKAAGPLHMWVTAQLAYANILTEVRPQLAVLERVRVASTQNESRLKDIRGVIRGLEASIERLKREYELAVFGVTGYTGGEVPAAAGSTIAGVQLRNWVPSKAAPRPLLHSSVLFAVSPAALSSCA